MTRINLLPWREARRLKRRQELIGMLIAAALVAVGVMYGVYVDIDDRIRYQRERNDYLRGEIARLKKAAEELQALQKTRNQLVERLNVIQKLQASRPGRVRLLDGLVRLIPQDIFLNSLTITGDRVTLNGIARSDTIISEFMRSIRDSNLFGEPSLQIIETRPVNNVQARVFELIVPLKPDVAEASAEAKS